MVRYKLLIGIVPIYHLKSSTTLDVRLAIYDSTGTLMANSSSAYGEAYAGACYLIANKNYFIKFWTGSHQKCTSILRIQQLY